MTIRLLAGIIAACSQCALAADALQDFAYASPIEGVGGDALYRVTITQQVYEGVAFADLRDLRVFNGMGEVVPHAFAPMVPEQKKPAAVTLPFFAIRATSGTPVADLDIDLESNNGDVNLRVTTRGEEQGPSDVLGYLIDLSAQPGAITELTLQWEPKPDGYVGSVNIESSNDLKHWSHTVRDAPLLRLSQGGQRLERNSVQLPNTTTKYLRLTWPNENERFTLTNVQAQPVGQREPLARAEKQVDAVAASGQAGEYLADLGGPFPVDRLTIRLPQDNAVAPVQVFSRGTPDQQWRPVVRSVAYRLRQAGQIIENPVFDISPRADRYWMLRVDQQGGGIGAGAIGIKAEWLAPEVIFAARGTGPFRLAFGNSRAQANTLSVHTLVPNWGRDDAPDIAMAVAGDAQTVAGPAATRPRIDTRKTGLWIALFAGVAVLGAMAWRLSRQVGTAEHPSTAEQHGGDGTP